jgi:radical SAM/Cys-rich protein
MTIESVEVHRTEFDVSLAQHGLGVLRRSVPTTLQLNIGLRCDLACHHCHVEAGPNRRETMDRRTADRVLELAQNSPGLTTLDLTGGAPELQPEFRHLVRGARAIGLKIIDRCNLTVLFQPGQQDTADFLAENEVRVIASLPCTGAETVDAQRGRRVFDRSIEALRVLGRLGYGRPGSPLGLDLVFNPAGDCLPPPQAELEQRYRRELKAEFGIEFHHLLAIANMPIKRFAHTLAREGKIESYLSLLVNHFNPDTVSELMCRTLVSVSYDGRVFDCDFNQMLGLPMGGRSQQSIWDIADLGDLAGQDIATASHCFGCTAGAGSSCGGALRV